MNASQGQPSSRPASQWVGSRPGVGAMSSQPAAARLVVGPEPSVTEVRHPLPQAAIAALERVRAEIETRASVVGLEVAENHRLRKQAAQAALGQIDRVLEAIRDVLGGEYAIRRGSTGTLAGFDYRVAGIHLRGEVDDGQSFVTLTLNSTPHRRVCLLDARVESSLPMLISDLLWTQLE